MRSRVHLEWLMYSGYLIHVTLKQGQIPVLGIGILCLGIVYKQHIQGPFVCSL